MNPLLDTSFEQVFKGTEVLQSLEPDPRISQMNQEIQAINRNLAEIRTQISGVDATERKMINFIVGLVHPIGAKAQNVFEAFLKDGS